MIRLPFKKLLQFFLTANKLILKYYNVNLLGHCISPVGCISRKGKGKEKNFFLLKTESTSNARTRKVYYKIVTIDKNKYALLYSQTLAIAGKKPNMTHIQTVRKLTALHHLRAQKFNASSEYIPVSTTTLFKCHVSVIKMIQKLNL